MSNLFKSKKQETSSTSFDPQIYGEALQNLQLAEQVAAIPFQAYTGPMVAPFTRDYMTGEQMTRGIAAQGGYVPEVEQAARATQAALGFQPSSVYAGQVQTQFRPGRISAERVGGALAGGPMQVQAGQVGAQFQAPTAQAAQFTGADLQGYMNPYQQGVIETGLGDIGRQEELARQQRAQRASAARAFGGSRAALQEGIAAGEAARERNRFIAEQRAQGFQQAAQLRESDVARQQQAALANQAAQQQAQQMGAAAEQFNVQQGMQAGLANQQVVQDYMRMGLTAEQANQQASLDAARTNQAARLQAQQMGLGAQQFNVEQAMRAALANQQTGMQGAQFRLGAAQQLSGLGQQALQNRYGAAQAMMGLGREQQQLAQQLIGGQQAEFMRRANYPLQQLAIRQGAIAASPINQQSSTTVTGRPSYAQIAAGIGSFGQSMGFGSDMRMKRDVSKIKNPLDKVNRLKGIEFEWEGGYGSQEGEDQGGKRDMSVSAQDVEKVMPSAVSRRSSDNMRQVDAAQMVGLLTEAVKELDKKVSKRVKK